MFRSMRELPFSMSWHLTEVGSLFGDVIIGRSDDSLLGFEAGGFQVFPDFLFDLRREIFLEKERVFMPSSVIR